MSRYGRYIGKANETKNRHEAEKRGGVVFKMHDVDHVDLLRLHTDKLAIPVFHAVLIECKTTKLPCYYVFSGEDKQHQWQAYDEIAEKLRAELYDVSILLRIEFRHEKQKRTIEFNVKHSNELPKKVLFDGVSFKVVKEKNDSIETNKPEQT